MISLRTAALCGVLLTGVPLPADEEAPARLEVLIEGLKSKKGSVALALFAGIIGFVLKAVLGLRVSDAEQVEGLDLGEHGMEAYPDFQPMVNPFEAFAKK